MGMTISGRDRRKQRIRKRVSGTAVRPRMSVFRSLKHVSVQIIDDVAGTTLVAASTYEKELGGKGNNGNKTCAKKIGETIAERAKAKGITTVVFDRNGCLYHGCVKELADAARQKGLVF